MAEFCLDCWNKINDENLTSKDVIISKDLDLCEECVEWKQIVVRYKRDSLIGILLRTIFRTRYISLPVSAGVTAILTF